MNKIVTVLAQPKKKNGGTPKLIKSEMKNGMLQQILQKQVELSEIITNIS